MDALPCPLRGERRIPLRQGRDTEYFSARDGLGDHGSHPGGICHLDEAERYAILTDLFTAVECNPKTALGRAPTDGKRRVGRSSSNPRTPLPAACCDQDVLGG